MFSSLLTPVSLLLLYLSPSVQALSSCVAFDINWNLLVFGLGGKDYNAGTQDAWAAGSATDITASGRPPFNGPNATCYLSQFGNAIYVLGADTSKPSSIYIYDATAKAWSTQAVTTGTFDPSNFVAILDHDTDVFYAISHGELFSLTMDTLKTAKPDPVVWNDVEAPPFTVTDPVMALAQNHIHFLDVPGVPAGSADIFVIHFAFFQPASQQYGNFPATHGQTASIFLDVGVQQEFVFVPDDGSATYVINVETNTTQTLAGPTIKDSGAVYFAAPNSIVQLASNGAVTYLAYNPNTTSLNAAAPWTTVKNVAAVAPPSSGGSGSSSGSSSSGGSKSSGGAGAGGASQTSGGNGAQTTGGGSGNTGKNGAVSAQATASMGMTVAILVGSVAISLMS